MTWRMTGEVPGGGADFTTRSAGGYQFFTNMYFMHSIEPTNSTCVQSNLQTVPASPAISTCVTCQCYRREHECSLSCSIRRRFSGACIECIPAHKPASESPQHTIPRNSRSRDSYAQNLYSIQVFWPISRRHDDHDTCVQNAHHRS